MYGTALTEKSVRLEGHLGVLSSHVLQKGMEQGGGFPGMRRLPAHLL